MKAFMMPLRLSCDCLVKKETVSGIIGNVQGIINPSSPPMIPRINILHRLFSPSAPVPPQLFTGLLRSTFVILIVEAELTPPFEIDHECKCIQRVKFLPLPISIVHRSDELGGRRILETDLEYEHCIGFKNMKFSIVKKRIFYAFHIPA